MSDSGLEVRMERLERLATELAPLPHAVGRLSDHMEGVESRLTNVESRLTNVESRLTTVDSRLTTVDSRLTTVDSRLTTVESEIVQLRTDMSDGFFATREDMAELARETARHFLEVRHENAKTQHQIAETQRQMRVLHEDVVERISRIGRG